MLQEVLYLIYLRQKKSLKSLIYDISPKFNMNNQLNTHHQEIVTFFTPQKTYHTNLYVDLFQNLCIKFIFSYSWI